MAGHGWWRRTRRAARRTPAPAVVSQPTSTDRAPAGAPLARLTTPQLCALWRKSWAGLRMAPTPRARAEVVSARAALLDELERREPQAMADWLTAGAVEPDGPSGYLLHQAARASDRR